MSDVLAPHTPAERMAVTFARVLRGAGLRVPMGSVLAFVDALGQVGMQDRTCVYWAGRATLVRKPEDFELYDRSFAVFWLSAAHDDADQQPDEPLHITLALDDEPDDDDHDGDGAANDEPTIVLRFSPMEVLRDKDFAAYTTDELRLAQELMSQLRFIGPPRHSFRSVAHAAAAGPTSLPPCAPPCEQAANPSVDTGANPASGCGGWWCCSTSRARWSRTLVRCCASCTPPSPAANAWKHSPSAPGSPG